MIGTLKARESELVDVKEISGSSAGSILALFLGVGMSIDEIFETSLNLNVPNFVKIRIGSFLTNLVLLTWHLSVKNLWRYVDVTQHSKRLK